MRTVKLLVVIVATLAGSACQRPHVIGPQVPARDAEIAAPTADSVRYAIDSTRSTMDILVFRGGPMARLGHNHVMSVRSLVGEAWIHSDVTRSTIALSFPVAELDVDDRNARVAAGAEFPPDVHEKDRQGTRANMLKPEVLDAARYPTIQMRSTHISGVLPELMITMAVTLKEITREIEVPAEVTLIGEKFQASGELALRQTDFGIKPFSVAMGAVQVQDELKIRFDLHGELL